MCTGNVGVAVLDPSYCEGSDLALGQFQNKKKENQTKQIFCSDKNTRHQHKKKKKFNILYN